VTADTAKNIIVAGLKILDNASRGVTNTKPENRLKWRGGCLHLCHFMASIFIQMGSRGDLSNDIGTDVEMWPYVVKCQIKLHLGKCPELYSMRNILMTLLK
jgi:hypothetical protein